MTRMSTGVLLGVLLGAGGVALMRSEGASAAKAEPAAAGHVDPGPSQPREAADEAPATLPPGHPPIDPQSAASAAVAPAVADSATLSWTAPPTWTTIPNPSSMRLATYRIPRAAGDAEDADVAITRAGGTTEANAARWTGQFADGRADSRSERTVHGVKITIVDVSGTYLGSGMSMAAGSAPGSHPSWALLGAIIEAPGMPYFLKITGPAATVHAARPAFDALLASLTPR